MITEEKTHDDILNEEIEQEHKEAEERNNTTVSYEYASEEESKIFEENLKDKNKFPIETSLTIKFVDFVDITEFNNSPITGGDYENKRSAFVKEHKRFNEELEKQIRTLLKSSGLIVTTISNSSRKYDPFISTLEQLKDSIYSPMSLKDLFKNMK